MLRFDSLMNYNFNWNDAPLHSLHPVILTTSVYVGIIILYSNFQFIRNIIRINNTNILNAIISLHNLVLSLGSLVMCIGTVFEVSKRSLTENSIEWIFCENANTKPIGWLWFWSYIYYLSKYYELFDTILQFLNNKIPPNFFLHIYHHSLVILMSWAWINYQASTQFVGIIFNTAVHVVMYYYYYLKSIGITPKWKSYVTKFQILQFAFSLIVIGICYYYAISRYFLKDDSNYPVCKGINILTSSLAFNVSLLIGFFGVLKANSRNRSHTTKKS